MIKVPNWSRLVDRFPGGLFHAAALVSIALAASTSSTASVPNRYLANYDQGYETGYATGYDFGYDLGYNRGETDGATAGQELGFDDGWDDAYEPAYDASYDLHFPAGHVDGYEIGFNAAVEEGFEWASEVHQWFLWPLRSNRPFGTWAIPLIDRWGDPSGWGNPGGTSGSAGVVLFSDWGPIVGVTISGAGNLVPWTEVEWGAHYYDEGYDVGYDEGKQIGDENGYDQAYPISFSNAYDPAFDEGFDEGDLQGSLDGAESGYEAGWSQGNLAGDNPGFRAGADFYVAGGSLIDFDLTAYLAGYVSPSLVAASQSVAEQTTVPEPSTLLLAGMALLVGLNRCDRKSPTTKPQ